MVLAQLGFDRWGGTGHVRLARPDRRGLPRLPRAERPGRTQRLDRRGRARLVAARGTEGRAAYLRLELLDLVYPLLCGLALLLVSIPLIRRLPGRTWHLLLIPAVAMTVLDYGENLAVCNLLSTWPAVGNLPAHLGGAATAAKRAAGLGAYLAVALLVLAVGVDRLRGDETAATKEPV